MILSAYDARPMAMVGRKHDALRMKARDVDDLDHARDLAGRLGATLVRQNGAGLAAQQVGQPLNLIVTSGEYGGRALANLRVTPMTAKTEEAREGCLTLPGRWFMVPRFTRIEAAALDLETGEQVTFTCSGFEARLYQHEGDHLAGELLIGRFPEVRG